ncbi:MAG: hypothetical protein V3R13_02255 [Nitrososphaerales archaeon]
MTAMILPEADANEAIKGIYSEIEDVFGKVPIASYAITKDPHGIDKNGLASFRRRLTDQEKVEIVSAINLFRYNRDDSCPFAPSPGVELFLKKVPSSRVCLSCSVRD